MLLANGPFARKRIKYGLDVTSIKTKLMTWDGLTYTKLPFTS